MSHTTHNKKKLIARINRLKGQMEAVERALEAERPCGDILQLLSSIRGALNGLTGEVLDDHLHEHVLHAADEKSRSEAIEEISEVLRTYIR
jgi:DNA-binding FrmR family transcriptional regulator